MTAMKVWRFKGPAVCHDAGRTSSAVFGLRRCRCFAHCCGGDSRSALSETSRSLDPRDAAGQALWPSPAGTAQPAECCHRGRHRAAARIPEDVWRAALASFVGLPHRMERVAEANGVLYINDSKATNSASTAPALGLGRASTGSLAACPRGADLDARALDFSHVVCARPSVRPGPLCRDPESVMPVQRSETLGDAVRQAMDAAAPGDVRYAVSGLRQLRSVRRFRSARRQFPPDRRSADCGKASRLMASTGPTLQITTELQGGGVTIVSRTNPLSPHPAAASW